MEIMILWNTTQRLKNKTLQHCPTIQVLLIKIIETPGTVLKLEGALPGTVVLYDGFHCLHCGLLNGFLLADADFHAIGQFLTQELSQLSDKMASVLSLMPCCIASYALLVMTGSRW